MSQCAPFAVFDGPIREVEQVTVDGQEVGVAAFQGPRESDQVFVVRVCFNGAADYTLGRVSDDLRSMVQSAHVLGRLLIGEVPAELLPC